MANLPIGTITFLYTDIEGSTKRWEEHPAEMKAAVERHDAIMRDAISAHEGCVFRTMGDAFCASFALAPQALAAALQAQRALHAEEWAALVSPFKVRMSLHTGIGEVRDGDYVGTPLNRVARLLSAGHGGQTLLSQATYDLVRDSLPPEVVLKDRGEHRLKDLQRPERIFELLSPDIPSNFPPLNTLDNRPNNLPMQRSPLIGREKELVAVQREILRDDVGLLTLTGPGGVGKTRLALQVAAELIDDFEDGVFFVPLSTIKDPELLPTAIAQALGIKEVPNQPLPNTLTDYLRGKRLLLVLDNFEQVIEAAHFVGDLMSAAPRLKAMVTSRESLHLYGERDFPVPPFPLPPLGEKYATPLLLERLNQYEAVRLFIERAMSVKPDFVVTNENAPAVAEICHRLDGLPLAIELAAARIAILPPAAMLARLQSRLKLLTGGARDLPARQQTLRGALMWSYDLLDPDEQLLFRRLSVFVGGCTLEAAEAVCGDFGLGEKDNPPVFGGAEELAIRNLQLDVLDGISSLVNKSLLRQIEGSEGGARFSMLETIREYALERLEESGEAPAMRRRHALYYIDLVSSVGSKMIQIGDWQALTILVRKFDVEIANLRAMIEWSQRDTSMAELALHAAWGLFWYYQLTSQYIEEGRRWIENVLVASDRAELRQSLVRAKALYAASYLAFLQGDFPIARAGVEESVAIMRAEGADLYLPYGLQLLGMVKGFQGEGDAAVLEESVALFRRSGDMWGIGLSLFTLGDVYLGAGDYDRARATHEESLAQHRSASDKWGSSLPLISLGRIAWIEGDYERARTLVEEGLELRREANNRWLTAIAIESLADIARAQARYEESTTLSLESLAAFRDVGDMESMAWSLYNLACVALYAGNPAKAAPLFKESLTIRKAQGGGEGVALCIAGLAQVAAASTMWEKAALLFGAADALFKVIVPRISPADHAMYEQNKIAARSGWGEERFNAAYSEGSNIPLEGAVRLALT